MELVFDRPTETTEVVEILYPKETLQQVVTQIEARYWLTGEYPMGTQLNEAFSTDFTILKAMLPAINKALEKRELPPYDPWKRIPKKDELDPAFVIAVNSLVDISDKRSKAIKLKAVGMTTHKFNVLLKSKQNKAYYEARAETAFQDVQPVAKTSLGRLVDSGDLQAIKYYHEFTGVHDPNRELNQNLNKIIFLFMEVLVRHVDPKLVDTISQEFEVKLLELK
jgi:hypothetical protein